MKRATAFSPLRGWVIWAVATLFVVYQLMMQNGFGAIAKDVQSDLELTMAGTGMLSASFLIVYSLMQLPVGLILDRANARLILGSTALMCGVLVYIFAQVEGLWAAIAVRACIGATAAFAFPGAGVLARRWIKPTQFALAMGLIDMSFGLGAVIGDAGFSMFLEHGTWRTLLQNMALVGIGIGVLILLLIRNRPHPSALGAPGTPEPTVSLRTSLSVLTRSRQIWLAMVFYAGTCGTMFSFGGLWNIKLQEAFGFSTVDSISLNSFLFLGMGLSAPVWGWLSDRMGRRKPFLVIGAIGSACTSGLIIFTPWAPYPVVATVMTIHGCFLGTSVLIFAAVCERIHREYSGAAIGMVNAAGCLFGGLLQIAPTLMVSTGRMEHIEVFQRAMSIFFVFHVLALIAALMLRDSRPGWARDMSSSPAEDQA
ncbi:MAG: MFS transporter [Phycisphaerales bacterium]|nr:MFS transporter [Phycisphaerales bacterium]